MEKNKEDFKCKDCLYWEQTVFGSNFVYGECSCTTNCSVYEEWLKTMKESNVKIENFSTAENFGCEYGVKNTQPEAV